MSRIIQTLVILSAPLAVLVAVFVIDRAAGIAGGGGRYVVRFDLPSVNAPVGLPRVDGPPDSSRPLVVIDPGHGGFDPGAGADAVREKDVALQIARAIRKDLLDGGGIRVALTRDADRFVSLGDRPDIARRLHADLFISIHADSAENDSARGASVYVLSEKGSSQAARRIAERENGAGRINGVPISQENANVGAILLDLSQRGAQAGSADLAGLILRELREADIRLHHGRVETAALAVLKAPDIPSVLFETGYINNAQDYAFLSSKKGQAVIAGAAAQAVRIYFARKAGV
ncbi:N-acetylmuramoyl-L-alanine amidase family protein [Novosphingobium beihaiensis]|uniref:N-acetylmuramoyl-L-alanine amidase n=1 Tax=Novosphingobium beihaiensis TaxID=2930389 RepID=A0ABT0BR15_9SPHN|nr:N-acetylmuramoyl-L-alanine amidase [Novosphingobium beihaiensis]MCJ2187308.1 N-acetylmuramoyl-L-alanine amidase [Novosphingobium beihaiensis]